MRKNLLLVLLAALVACRKDPVVQTPPPPEDTIAVKLTPYDLRPPAYFLPMEIPEDNKPYVERIALGRRLFYDPVVTGTGVSCGSCHVQAQGFTSDTLGPEGRRTMPLVNLAWTTHWGWQGTATGPLETAVPFQVHPDFRPNLQQLNADTAYQRLFGESFGVRQITQKEIRYALAQFLRTLLATDAPYYQSLIGQRRLTPDEEKGQLIFFSERGDCFHCHLPATLADNDFHNIGLDSLYTNAADKGRFNVTGAAADVGRFRTPNLYNVALRKRFMHDGRFRTLEEVVDFYDSGVRRPATIDPVMTKPGKEDGLNLTEQEKDQLVAFLKTLTDSVYLQKPAFSRP